MITIRRIDVEEVEKLRDINRTETIRTGYRYENGQLVQLDVNWDDGGWHEGDGEHSFSAMIREIRRYMALDGMAIGAFDGERLVGLAVYRPRLRSTMGQLAGLHVGNGYRRRGIASRLLDEVLALARDDGTTQLYVSATPTGSAVAFYLRHGFAPTDEPDAELLEEEPEDIHMVLEV